MKLRSVIERIGTSISHFGVIETLKAVVVRIFSYRPERDRSFDRRYKTDTMGTVAVDALGIADEQARQAALYYVSAPARFERHILGSLEINHKDFDFVDMGCGKGRVLMLASDWPFRSVTGVEISRGLCAIAERNLRIYRSPRQKCTDVRVCCMDARQFEVAEENTVFHFYHPFNTDVLRPVLERIRSRFGGSAKKVLILYIWSQLPDLFPLFEDLRFIRLRFVEPLNRRYQYGVFTL